MNGRGWPHESPTSRRREGSPPHAASSRSRSARRPVWCLAPTGCRLTSSYRMGQIRTDLATAATSELNARIDYLNALTALERVEGTVLDRWGITVEDATAEAMMKETQRREEQSAGMDTHDTQAERSARTKPEEGERTGPSRRHPTTSSGAADTSLLLRLEDVPETPETVGLRLMIGDRGIPLR